MKPYFIEKRFKLRTPIYSETASYGHMGRESKVVEKTFTSAGKTKSESEAFSHGKTLTPWPLLRRLLAKL